MRELVTVITPAYNAEAYLESCSQSVLNQTYQNWEHIIVVDIKSQDKTYNIAKKLAESDKRIKVVHNEHCNSVSANRNIGIEYSSGNYICFLDADDIWLPNKLETQLNFMLQKNSNFSFHDFDTFSIQDGKQFIHSKRRFYKDADYQTLLKNNMIGCSTVMIKKDLLNQYMFPNAYHEDYILWLTILKTGVVAHHIPQSMMLYRLDSNSLSGNKFKSALWRWKTYNHFQIPTWLKCYYFLNYVIISTLKRF